MSCSPKQEQEDQTTDVTSSASTLSRVLATLASREHFRAPNFEPRTHPLLPPLTPNAIEMIQNPETSYLEGPIYVEVFDIQQGRSADEKPVGLMTDGVQTCAVKFDVISFDYPPEIEQHRMLIQINDHIPHFHALVSVTSYDSIAPLTGEITAPSSQLWKQLLAQVSTAAGKKNNKTWIGPEFHSIHSHEMNRLKNLWEEHKYHLETTAAYDDDGDDDDDNKYQEGLQLCNQWKWEGQLSNCKSISHTMLIGQSICSTNDLDDGDDSLTTELLQKWHTRIYYEFQTGGLWRDESSADDLTSVLDALDSMVLLQEPPQFSIANSFEDLLIVTAMTIFCILDSKPFLYGNDMMANKVFEWIFQDKADFPVTFHIVQEEEYPQAYDMSLSTAIKQTRFRIFSNAAYPLEPMVAYLLEHLDLQGNALRHFLQHPAATVSESVAQIKK